MEFKIWKHDNNELTVVNSAKVSMDAFATNVEKEEIGLLNYLIRNGHVSTTFHATMVFEVCGEYRDIFDFLYKTRGYGFQYSKFHENHEEASLLVRGSLWSWINAVFSKTISKEIEERFPNIYKKCEDLGVFKKYECNEYVALEHTKENGLQSKLFEFLTFKFVENSQISEYFDLSYESSIIEYARILPVSARVTGPIFVNRQWAKTQDDMKINEVSRRYVKTPPTFYEQEYRKKPEASIKQGSSSEAIAKEALWSEFTTGYYDKLHGYDITHISSDWYDFLVNKKDIAPECARADLPLRTNTSWVQTGGLLAYGRLHALRGDNHAQKEIREELNKLMDEELTREYMEVWGLVKGIYRKRKLIGQI